MAKNTLRFPLRLLWWIQIWVLRIRDCSGLLGVVTSQLWLQRQQLEAAQRQWHEIRGKGLDILFPSVNYLGAIDGLMADWEQAVANLSNPPQFDFSSEAAFRNSIDVLVAEAKRLQVDVEQKLGIIRSKVGVAEKALSGEDMLIEICLWVVFFDQNLTVGAVGGTIHAWGEFFTLCARQLDSVDSADVDAVFERISSILPAIQKKKRAYKDFSVQPGVPVSSHETVPLALPRLDAWETACSAAAREKEKGVA